MTIAKDGDALVAAPPAGVRLFLFHGPEEAQAVALARALEARLGGERVVVDAKTLAAQPGALADEAAAVTMFGGAQVLSVRGAGDAAGEAAALLLAGPGGGHPCVMVAGDLKKTSALRKLAEAHPAARAIPCYPPDARAMAALAREMARARGLDAEPAALALIAAAAAGERGVVGQELDKLALYMDAGPDRRRRLEAADVRAVGAGEGGDDVGPLIDAITARDAPAAARALARVAGDGAGGIATLRAVGRRLAQVADARAGVDAGATPAVAVKALRPPVFWKEEGAVIAAAAAWRGEELAAARARLLAAERAIVAPASAGARLGDAALLWLAAAPPRG